MAYAKDFVRVTIGGSAYQETEIWNTGFNIITSPGQTITPTFLDQVVQIVAVAWEEFFQNDGSKHRFPQTHTTEFVKASHIGTNGKVVNNEVREYFYEPALKGSGTKPFPAAQLSMVVTLRSAIRKGPGALGRMYLPALLSGVEENGLVSDTSVQLLSEMFSTFIDYVDYEIGENASVGLVSPAGEGVQSSVVSFRIDNRIDTQRRRANHLPASGVFVPVNGS